MGVLLVCDVPGCENAELVPYTSELWRAASNAGWDTRNVPDEETGIRIALICPAGAERLRLAEDDLQARFLQGVRS